MNKLKYALLGFWLAATWPAAGQSMNIEQTLSDQAQGMTIAFDGLAFLTGSLGADSFLPPGKVADFSGFQYLRDNDPTQMGHNTDFVTIIARNVLTLLSDTQKSQMVERAKNQVAFINQYGYMRFPLMEAFRRRLSGDMPDGCSELDLSAVKKYSGELYYLDGLISLDRAMLFGDILRNLTPSQEATLRHLATLGGVGNWPQNLADPLQNLHLDPEISVGVMTYASEMFSWYAGSVAADTYFCPERQGTYFGSFYLKDAPAMGNAGYSIDTNLTANAGDAFLALLTPAQRQLVTNLVTVQKPWLYELVNTRSNIAGQLRQYLTTTNVNTNTVLDLCTYYGELDGAIVYSYATHFSQVSASLSTNQQAELMAMRLKMLGPDLLYPKGAYLYSAPITMPAITNTDFLFASPITNCLALEDTGQTQNYTATSGEDADYTINPPSFTISGDGTVIDNVTGLIWQKVDSGEMTWENALVYAQTNRIGGYADWRLPTSHELFAILNHGASNPALDTNSFTATAAQYWWTSEIDAGDSNRVWVANAGGGLGPHPKSETMSAGGIKRFHARCVRGPFLLGRAAHRLADNQDGTVTDLDTGLTWQQTATTNMLTWENALQYAENLTFASQTDWRLPNIKELQSLSDPSLSNPCWDTNYFPGASAARYWSSTTEINGTNRAWHLDFQTGIVSYDDKFTELRVRCVRGGLASSNTLSVVAAGAGLTQLASGLQFTESPAADAQGNIYFSAIPSETIYKWSLNNQLSVFQTNSGGANGLAFDAQGNLLACEGGNGCLASFSPQGTSAILGNNYAGTRFNEPNDLWIDPAGGVYFTDPVYLGHPVLQGGEFVYYLSPDRTSVRRVATDMVRPNGLVGTPDGQTLYLADWGATNIFRYHLNSDGALANKTLFAQVQCDGMTLDAEGQLYFCENAVLVYDTAGNFLEQIAVPERPTNVEFGGSDRKTLFITTDAGSLYSIRMRVSGVVPSTLTNHAPAISHTCLLPSVSATNSAAWVTTQIQDDGSITNVTLTCSTGTNGFTAQTNTIFLETMAANTVKPWTGNGADHAWTVTFAGVNPFEQRDGANFGGGHTNGLEFKGGTTNLTDSLLTLTSGIDASGNSGFVEFALWSDGLSGNAGWAFQLDAGTGYVTRLSELSGTNHDWRIYHYDLQAGELAGSLKMRWQFRGGPAECRIDLDQITAKTVATNGIIEINMMDDGLHQDGAAGDGVYGAELPVFPAGTAVSYYITATDNLGATTTDPEGAPIGAYSGIPWAVDPTPVLLSCQKTPSGLELKWTAQPNHDYVVLYKATLGDTAWACIATNQATDTTVIFTDAAAGRLGQPQGFYAITLLP